MGRIYTVNVFVPDGLNTHVIADSEREAIEQAKHVVEQKLSGTVRADLSKFTYYATPLEHS